MIISKTPYRLSLFGGGTDYPSWFTKNPSKVLAASMANYCYINVKKLPPYFDHKNRIIYSKIESVSQISEIEHPSVRSCLQFTETPEGISVTHDGDLPARSGIGSSSSFTVGLLNALNALKGVEKHPQQLAKDAIYVEQKIIGESVGIQDQIMASYGGLKIIHMNENGWYLNEVRCSWEYIQEFEKHIMLGFSGISRLSDIYAQKQVENINKGSSVSTLYQMQEITNYAIQSFENEESFASIGNLMHLNWQLKRNLTEGVSTSHIDNIYDTAIQAGAFGGKLMGAGGGGFFMFIAPPEKHDSIKEKLKDINVWIPFKFDFDGSKIIMR